MLASIALMTADHRYRHLDRLRSALATLVYPLQYAVSLPVGLSRKASEALASRRDLVAENAALRRQQLLQQARLQRFAILEAENQRLRALLESSIALRERVLIAELVEVELQPFRQQVVINKGSRDAAYAGQPIMDAGGILGQIIHIAPFSSTALLITDPTHAIPVQVNRNGLRAIAVGTGQDTLLLLQHLPTNADVQTGDLIVSSGLGRRFPRGYPVGTVSRVSRIPGEPFANITVIPSAQPGRRAEVLLLWPDEPQSRQDSASEVVMK